MSLTVLQKTNIYFGRTLDFKDTTLLEKTTYLVRAIGRSIGKKEITITNSTEAQLTYWKGHAPYLQDKAPVIDILDKVTSLTETTDEELTTVATQVLTDMFLSYDGTSAVSPIAMM